MMRSIHIALTLISFSSLAEPNCLEFWRNWKTCSSEQFPDISRDKLLCFHELDYSSEVLISRENEKQSAILCHNKTFPSYVFDCLPIKDSSLVIIKNCPFPPPKFDKVFGNENSTLKTLQLQYENLKFLHDSLHITFMPFLQSLSVNNIRTTNHFNLVLDSLPLLIILSITNHNFTSLPETPFRNAPQLQALTISEGTLEFFHNDVFSGINPIILDLSYNRLRKCSPLLLQNLNGLKKLNLSHNCIEKIDDLFFENTPDLEIIILDYNKLATLPSGLFSKTPNITVLFLNHNKLQNISETMFSHLYRLQVLSLNNNRLTSLSPDIFSDLVSLMWLDLQFNQISTLPDTLFNWLGRLHVVDLSDNKISKFSSSIPFGSSKFLSKINISGNHLDEVPDIHWLQYNISQLDLSRNSIRQIVLPIKIKPRSTIFLQDNEISTVIIKRPLNTEAQYYLQGNPFHCSCNLSDFIHFAPHLSVIDAEKLKCHTPWYRNHNYLRTFNKISKLCETKDDCPSMCQCHLSTNNEVTLDCRNLSMTDLPHSLPLHTTIIHFENNELTFLSASDWLEVTHLYLSNNSLTSLHNWTIPPKLQFLAIDGNKLTDLSSALMETIDNSSDFRIYLADNEWLCDCNAVELKKWLMRNLPKIQDSMRTYCNNYDHKKQSSLMVESRVNEFLCSGASSNACLQVQLYIVISIILFLSSELPNKLL